MWSSQRVIRIKAVFVDRDGTLNLDHGYVHKVEDLKILPFVKEGLELLQREDFKIIILSNQSGINRGLFNIQDMTKFNVALFNELDGIRVARIYFCPHTPEEECKCRKPGTANLEKAVKEMGLDKSQCWVIGDSTCDIEMARKAKVKSVLVMSGNAGSDGKYKARPVFVAMNFLEAARYIIKRDADDNNKDAVKD